MTGRRLPPAAGVGPVSATTAAPGDARATGFSEIVLPGIMPRITARAYGPEGGHPVLALHGWLDNAATFAAIAPLLSPHHRLIAVDLPGHGWSDHRSADASYSMLDWTLDVVKIADALALREFSIVGHSMGAGIASLVAAAVKERCLSLALIEGLAPLPGKAEDAPARLSAYVAAAARQRPVAVYATEDEALALRVAAGAFASPESIRGVVRRNLKELASGGFSWRSDPRLRLPTAIRLTSPQVESFLSSLRCPVLVVTATEGILHMEPELGSFLTHIPGVEHREVAGFHHVHLETPAPVALAINLFWDRVLAAAARR